MDSMRGAPSMKGMPDVDGLRGLASHIKGPFIVPAGLRLIYISCMSLDL